MTRTSEQRLYRNRQWLKKMYWEKNMTLNEIADFVGVEGSTILSWMKKFGIKRRKTSWRAAPRYFCVRVCLSEYEKKSLEQFSQEQKEYQSVILREALLKYMIEKNFNPYKET